MPYPCLFCHVPCPALKKKKKKHFPVFLLNFTVSSWRNKYKWNKCCSLTEWGTWLRIIYTFFFSRSLLSAVTSFIVIDNWELIFFHGLVLGQAPGRISSIRLMCFSYSLWNQPEPSEAKSGSSYSPWMHPSCAERPGSFQKEKDRHVLKILRGKG